MQLTAAIVARNEADRYLARVIARCQTFADQILLLDDHSTDSTPKLAKDMGCQVRSRSGDLLWGNESPARAELWNWAHEEAGDGWVLICDADQLLEGDPRPYCQSWDVNAWAFPLFDCWDSETQFRADGYWQGYQYARPWLFCPSRIGRWEVESRALHAGHCPPNTQLVVGVADLHWLHLAYCDPGHRAEKRARYLAKRHLLNPHEIAHAESI